MKVKARNQISLGGFSLLLGITAGAVVWFFLKAVSIVTELLWGRIPELVHIPFYPILVCTLGGILIGLFRKKYGDYPEELNVVMAKAKQEKHYDYSNMLVMLIAAFLPLVFGASVGPEAGLTGVIVGLCYWAGDNLKFAHEDAREYSEIGAAVSLSVLFRAPLFGIFAVEEESGESTVPNLSRKSKLWVYGLALAGSMSVYLLLSSLFGAGMSGFPKFDNIELRRGDYAMLIVYIVVGIILAKFYELTHEGSKKILENVPMFWKTVLGGLFLGIVGTIVPAVMFSGEEQMGELMSTYLEYAPIALIGVAFLKVLLTNLCIQSGLKGGHFFPVIFAGVCLGYAVAMLVFPESAGHMVFGAAVVTASMLGAIMKKPLAVTMLLFLCFPVDLFLWIFLAAMAGSKVIK